MRRFNSTFAILLSLAFILPASTIAQSGRGRPVTPTRETKPAPAPTITVPEATTVVKQEQAGSLSRFVLKNGITVIINEQHAVPVAAAVAYIKAGAGDEAEGASGASALLARVMHRGTQFRSGEKLAADMRAAGGLMDAEAAFDHTTFSFTAPADKVKEALAVQADLLQNPALTEADVKKELALQRYAVYETMAAFADRGENAQQAIGCTSLNVDSPRMHSLTRLMNLAFSHDKVGRSLQANPQLSREQLLDFYRAQYRPDNLIITVAGAVSTFHTLVEIQRLYGTFKKQEPAAAQTGDKTSAATSAGKKPKEPAAVSDKQKAQTTAGQATANQKSNPLPAAQNSPAAPAQTTNAESATPVQAPVEALRYANERGLIHQSIVGVGFRLAGLNAKDQATLEVLAAVLGQGRGSRLHRSLFAEQSVVNRVESRLLTFSDKGLLVVQMWVAPGAIDKAESALFRELNKFRREMPAAAEIVRARMGIENRFFAGNGTSADRAALLAGAEATGNFRSLHDYRKRIGAVTAEDVQRAAAKYLTLTSTAVHEYEASTATPRSFDTEKFAQTVNAWSPTFAEAVDSKQVRATDDKSLAPASGEGIDKSFDELNVLESIQPLGVKNFSTLNGPRAYVREDHTQPRVTFALLLQGGQLVEEENQSGITELMLRWMLYGTARHPQAAQELEQLGARIEVINDLDFYGLLVDVLSTNADAALKITRELLEDPAFRDEDFKLARTEQLSLIHIDRDSARARSGDLLMQSLFAGHSYSQSRHGNEEVLGRLKEDDVRAWHGRTVKRQMPLVIIVGDTEGSALVSSDIATGFKRNDTDATIKARVPPAIKPAEKVEARGFPHTLMALGLPGAKGNSDELAAIEVIKAALNGRGGRLMMELRDNQGVAYNACLDEWASLIVGMLNFYVASAPENEQRARAALLAELDKLAKSGLAAEAFSSAKAVARTAVLLRLQSQRERTLAYARKVLYGKQAADIDSLEEGLTKVTAEEVKRVLSAYFKTNLASFGIVRGSQTQK